LRCLIARTAAQAELPHPIFSETPLTAKLVADSTMRQEIVARTPLEQLVTPEEVAAAILFLASAAAAAVTGHLLAVDGGWLAQQVEARFGKFS
jgi:NAD(P)-dependent dehydrogenase (short-subunit alcohol dehydrogenase family)